MRRFLALFPAPTRRALYLALILSAALAALDFVALVLLFPVFSVLASGAAADAQVGGPIGLLVGDTDARTLVVAAMSVMIVRSLAGFANRFWWSRKVAEAEVGLSSRLMSAYAYAPYAFHLRRNSADLLSRAVSHVNMATGAGLNGLVLLAVDATTVLGLSAALFVASPVAAALVCGYLAALGALFVFLSRRFVAAHAQRFGDEVSQVYRRATTVLRGIRELTVAGGREAALGSIEQSRRDMVRAQRSMVVLADVPRLVLEVALYAATLIALLIVLNGSRSETSLPVVALYIVAALRILPAIARSLGNLTQARTGFALGEQVGAELAEVESAGPQRQAPAGALPRRGELVLDNVSFGYDAGPVVLSDVRLVVPFGSSLAIVGPSGSGKSTLLGLVLGLLEPTSGSVSYGGAAVGLADPEWLRHVAYVPQDVFVLDDTVLANVALGDLQPDEARAWNALERASVAGVVRAMPGGLATRLGEAGSRLSAGQRQRLGIARALYRDPAVLLLDEPTAALDRATESQVMETINELGGSVTLVLVAHRLETIASMDAIMRMDDGRLTPVTRATADSPERSRGSR